MSEEYHKKVSEYITLLEATNGELLKSLKQCHLLLEHFTALVPDPDSWMDMLENFQNVIDTGEKLFVPKIYNARYDFYQLYPKCFS